MLSFPTVEQVDSCWLSHYLSCVFSCLAHAIAKMLSSLKTCSCVCVGVVSIPHGSIGPIIDGRVYFPLELLSVLRFAASVRRVGAFQWWLHRLGDRGLNCAHGSREFESTNLKKQQLLCSLHCTTWSSRFQQWRTRSYVIVCSETVRTQGTSLWNRNFQNLGRCVKCFGRSRRSRFGWVKGAHHTEEFAYVYFESISCWTVNLHSVKASEISPTLLLTLETISSLVAPWISVFLATTMFFSTKYTVD